VSYSTGKFTAPAPHEGQPTEGEGYMIVAHDLLPAVEALSILPPSVHPRGCGMLAAHALECVLKAFLWHKGKKELRGEHDLLKLWEMACKEGLSVPQVPPDWVTILSLGHGPNFYFRYQEGVKVNNKHVIVHGGSYPALVPMTTALKNLTEMVGLAVKD
jgi:hypothetical protein